MKKDKYLTFVIAVCSMHLGLLFGGYMFLGLEYSLLIAFCWATAWIAYCGTLKRDWDKEGDYKESTSVPALALIGGPFSWILYPMCLIPEKHREASGSGKLWFVAQRIINALKDSVMKVMGCIHSFCEKDFPAIAEKE